MGQQQDPRFQAAPGPSGFRVPRAQETSADVLAPASVFPSATDPFEAFGQFASPLPAPGPFETGTGRFRGTEVPTAKRTFVSPITDGLSVGGIQGQGPDLSVPLGGAMLPGGAQQLGGLPGQGLSGAIQAILANPGVFPRELAATLAPDDLAILIPFFETQQLFAAQEKAGREDFGIVVGEYLNRIAQGDSDRKIAADMLQLAQDTFERTGVDAQATLDQLLIEFKAEQKFRLEQQGYQADQAAAQATFRTTQLKGELEGRTATAVFRTEEQRLQAIRDEETAGFRTQQQAFQREESMAEANLRTLQESNRAIEAAGSAQFRADQLLAQQRESIRTQEFRLEQLGVQRSDLALRKTQGEETIAVAREELQFHREVAEVDETLARLGLKQQERDRLLRETLGIEQNEINRARVEAEERRIDVEAATAIAVQESRSRTSLQQAALENPFGFAALNTLGGFPGAGGTAQPTQGPSSFQAGLGPLGFQVPQGAQAGQTGPASQFFQGGNIPTLGALQQIGPDALQFLSSILGFTGTSPQAFGRQSAGITPGTQTQFQLPQLFGGVPVPGRG